MKYAVTLWISLLFYAVASFFTGSAGLIAYNELKGENAKQQQNVEALKRTNAELTARRDAWERDRDTIAVHARELGYGTKTERFIRISGLSNPMPEQIEAGEIYIASEPRSVSNKALCLTSIALFILITAGIIVFDVLRSLRDASGRRYRQT
jgi:cell division protein FtsB